MSIVNSILNLVDLNTTKYSRKLRNMRRDTKKESKGIADSFKAIGSAWKSVIAGLTTGALAGAVISELKSTEKAVASFISATGSLTEARDQFEMLQQAARDTLQPFESLKAAALDLKKNGIQATGEQLKTFSQIAYGTGQSLETVSKAFTATIQGKYKQLNALGITAKDAGDKLVLTYKGVTQEIDKNTKALSDYFSQLGSENEGVLDYLQNGITGAFNHLDNAWGDFYRALGESGLGDLIRDMVREAASSLDDITAWINENREPIKAFFEDIYSSWQEIKQVTTDTFRDIKEVVDDFWESSGLAAATGTNNMIAALSQLFNFARMGFVEVMRYSNLAWEAVKGTAAAQWEGITTTITEFSLDAGYKAFDSAMGNMRKNMDTINHVADSTMQDIARNTRKRIQEIEDSALGYGGPAASGSYRTWENQNNAPEGRSFGTSGVKTGGGRSSGGGRAQRAEIDNWQKYYESILSIQKNGYSEAEKLRKEHEEKLAELEREYKASHLASETEYQNAKLILEKDFQSKAKELRMEALEFIKSIGQTDIDRVTDEYRQKMEKLEQFHEDSLISEQEFLEKRNALREEYEKAREEASGKKSENDFLSKEDLENVNNFTEGMTSLSDAFSNLTTGMSQSSSAYKALFAIQKSFAIASATANAIVAWTQALSDTSNPTWFGKLAAYANAVALTAGIIAQLKSLSMHDKGGRIGAGQLGIVGEYGPEIVSGPVNVTSRKKTAALARDAMYDTGSGDVIVNLYEDRSKAGTVENSESDGDRIVNIFVSNIRKGGQAAQALENTYQLRRYGA